MSETTIDEQVENQEPEAQAKPQGEAEPEASETGQEEPQGAPAVDWKAEARKWEARAKDNKAKADEAEERAIKTEAELEKARLVTRIAQETGVPESAEELEASAKAAAEWAASLAPAYPSDKGGSATAPTVTRESIEGIKDPIARIRARAENADLYR